MTKQHNLPRRFKIEIDCHIDFKPDLLKPETLIAMDKVELNELLTEYLNLETEIEQNLSYISDWQDALISASNKLDDYKEAVKSELKQRNPYEFEVEKKFSKICKGNENG